MKQSLLRDSHSFFLRDVFVSLLASLPRERSERALCYSDDEKGGQLAIELLIETRWSTVQGQSPNDIIPLLYLRCYLKLFIVCLAVVTNQITAAK